MVPMLVDTALLMCYIWMEAHESEKLEQLRELEEQMGALASMPMAGMSGVPDVLDVDHITVRAVVAPAGDKGVSVLHWRCLLPPHPHPHRPNPGAPFPPPPSSEFVWHSSALLCVCCTPDPFMR